MAYKIFCAWLRSSKVLRGQNLLRSALISWREFLLHRWESELYLQDNWVFCSWVWYIHTANVSTASSQTRNWDPTSWDNSNVLCGNWSLYFSEGFINYFAILRPVVFSEVYAEYQIIVVILHLFDTAGEPIK